MYQEELEIQEQHFIALLNQDEKFLENYFGKGDDFSYDFAKQSKRRIVLY